MPTITVSETETTRFPRYRMSDDDLEAAAEEIALSYTYQTSAYDRCCS